MTMSAEACVSEAGAARTVATELTALLWQLGVRQAFGICGREITCIWAALIASARTDRLIATHHMRHENGAGYAAVGSWASSGRPAAVFVTTGPGVTNVMTSLETARAAGAQVILLSPLTPAGHRGRLGIQDTSNQGYHDPVLYAPGRLFDLVALLESPSELQPLAGQLAAGLANRDRAFMAHIAVPTALQGALVDGPTAVPRHEIPAPGVSAALADEMIEVLRAAPFAVWVGWGARRHAAAVRRLLDLTGAPAMTSPRGLGIVDRHPQFIGVTGNGGHDTVIEGIRRWRPEHVLVLGSGLGEATSGWRRELAPPGGFVHVDVDARVFGRSYPQVPTLGVQADVGDVLAALVARARELERRAPARGRGAAPVLCGVPDNDRPVDPRALMAAIQRVVVDGTCMPVLADAASAMFWAAHHLVFAEPGRWFVENRFGAMGAAAAAVIGAAGRGGRALAIVGDGALHMQDELNAAVGYGIGAIWVVLNDSGLGIVRTGMRLDGYREHDADYPPTDFAAVARAKGADGIRVERACELDAALERALDASGPFVVDVVIDPDVVAPIGARRVGAVLA
jgi:acetolactate synthase-1/2/3 large subunit